MQIDMEALHPVIAAAVTDGIRAAFDKAIAEERAAGRGDIATRLAAVRAEILQEHENA